jgi:hypothetical protein
LLIRGGDSASLVFLQKFRRKKFKRIVPDEFLNFLILSSALKYFSVVMSVFLFVFFNVEEADRFAYLPFVRS